MALPMSPCIFSFPVMNAVVGFNFPMGKKKFAIQGLQTSSVIRNFDVRGRNIGQISKVKVFSWS